VQVRSRRRTPQATSRTSGPLPASGTDRADWRSHRRPEWRRRDCWSAPSGHSAAARVIMLRFEAVGEGRAQIRANHNGTNLGPSIVDRRQMGHDIARGTSPAGRLDPIESAASASMPSTLSAERLPAACRLATSAANNSPTVPAALRCRRLADALVGSAPDERLEQTLRGSACARPLAIWWGMSRAWT
jgi:hypothetical protein